MLQCRFGSLNWRFGGISAGLGPPSHKDEQSIEILSYGSPSCASSNTSTMAHVCKPHVSPFVHWNRHNIWDLSPFMYWNHSTTWGFCEGHRLVLWTESCNQNVWTARTPLPEMYALWLWSAILTCTVQVGMKSSTSWVFWFCSAWSWVFTNLLMAMPLLGGPSQGWWWSANVTKIRSRQAKAAGAATITPSYQSPNLC